MGQGEYLGKHRTLSGRRFMLYKRVAPTAGRFDAINFFAASEDDSTVDDISFMFGIGQGVAKTRGITNIEGLIRFLTPIGLRHLYLILEEAEYGSQHRKILGPESPEDDFNPDDSAFGRKINESVKLDILEFLERSERNSRPRVTFTNIVNGCYALPLKLRFVLDNLIELGLVNDRNSSYSISQEGLTELQSMEMMKGEKIAGTCGSCNRRGDTYDTASGTIKWDCLFDGTMHRQGDLCEHWIRWAGWSLSDRIDDTNRYKDGIESREQQNSEGILLFEPNIYGIGFRPKALIDWMKRRFKR